MALLEKEIFTYQNTVASLLTNLKAKQRGITSDTTNRNLLYKLGDNTPMLVANSHVYSGGTWVALDQDFARVSTTGLKDSRMSGSLPISQVGNTTLVGFTANSVIGCLNELHTTMVSIALPVGEIAFGNETNDGITSSPNFTFKAGLLSRITPTSSQQILSDGYGFSHYDWVSNSFLPAARLYSSNGRGLLELSNSSKTFTSQIIGTSTTDAFTGVRTNCPLGASKLYSGNLGVKLTDYGFIDAYTNHFNGGQHAWYSLVGGYGVDSGVTQDFYINCNGTTPNVTVVRAGQIHIGRKDYNLFTADPSGRIEFSVSSSAGSLTPVLILTQDIADVYGGLRTSKDIKAISTSNISINSETESNNASAEIWVGNSGASEYLQMTRYGSTYPTTSIFTGISAVNASIIRSNSGTFQIGSTNDTTVYICANRLPIVEITKVGVEITGTLTCSLPVVTLTPYTHNSTSLMYPDGCSICADNQQTVTSANRFSGVLLRTENGSSILQHATIGVRSIAGSVYNPLLLCTIQTGVSSYRTIWDATADAGLQYFQVYSVENHAVYASTFATSEPAAGGSLYISNTLGTGVEGQCCFQTFFTENSSKSSFGTIGSASAISSAKYSPSFFFGGNIGTSAWQEYAYLSGGDDARGTNYMLYAAGIYAGLSVTTTLGQLRIWDAARTNAMTALDWNAMYLHTDLEVFIGKATAATAYDLNVNNGIVACQIASPANSTASTGGAVDWNFAGGAKFRYTDKITSDASITILNLLANVNGTLLLQMGTTARKVTLNCTGTTFNLIGTTATSANSLEIPASAFHGNEFSVVHLHFAGTAICYVHVETE